MGIDNNPTPLTTLAKVIMLDSHMASSGDAPPPSDARRCILPSGLRAMPAGESPR
jgi:hypothetical protein